MNSKNLIEEMWIKNQEETEADAQDLLAEELFEEMRNETGIRRQSHAVLALGISICLIGAFLMAAGESLLGTDQTGIATIVGIVGIGLIASSRRTMH
jgi:hypothetical protein